MRHPEVFATLGITPPRGFLLHGPPGCGKTLLAHAIAGVCSIHYGTQQKFPFLSSQQGDNVLCAVRESQVCPDISQ